MNWNSTWKASLAGLVTLGTALATGLPASAQEAYKIGVILPLTGPTADYGSDFRAGAVLAEQAINDNGGIDGKKVQLVFGDSKNQAREGVAEFRRLSTVEGIPVIISTMTGVIQPQFSIARESGTPLVCVGATSVSIRKEGAEPNSTIFSTYPLADDEERQIAEYAFSTLGLKEAAVIYENSAYGKGLSSVFMEEFKKLGGEIVAEEVVETGGRDFRSQLTNIRAKNPPLIVTYAYYAEAGLIVRQSAELGIKAQFMSHGAVQNAAFGEIAGPSAEGFIAGSPRVNETLPMVQEFTKRYKEAYGKEPDLYGPYFYDAIHVIASAIQRGGYSKEGIVSGLKSMKDLQGVTGSLNFGPDNVVSLPLSFFRFVDGEWVRIEG
jgi:branched-chain amino acid transport system substrate-binding protein